MARGGDSGSSELIMYGVLGYLGYYAGMKGYLGKTVYNTLQGIKQGETPAATPAKDDPAKSVIPVTPVVNPCDMISNTQYVSYSNADNRWWVVVNSKIQYRVQSKDLAEAIYRWMCCGNAAPPGSPSEWT
jgi:hypothetical protein